MALSYSAIIGRGKFTLPSVEDWGTNTNIIRDPPRSIVAPRRDKVGSNSAIIEDIEMSRDRIAECILAYGRGINPMVGVSYNGSGNAGIGVTHNRGQQAKLPYRVMMDGAFRPPVLAPVDLLPLSRMPRLITHVNCAVNKPDFQKKLKCVAEKNTYRPQLLNTSCCAVATQNIARPSVLIDPRHTNNRHNPLARDVVVNSAMHITGDMNASMQRGTCVDTRTKPHLGAQALNLNVFRGQHQTAEAGANVHSLNRHIGQTLVGAFQAPVGAPKRADTAPVSLSGCREEVLHAEILPQNIIGHVVNTVRPEYKRAFGLGGIVMPSGGVYNSARR